MSVIGIQTCVHFQHIQEYADEDLMDRNQMSRKLFLSSVLQDNSSCKFYTGMCMLFCTTECLQLKWLTQSLGVYNHKHFFLYMYFQLQALVSPSSCSYLNGLGQKQKSWITGRDRIQQILKAWVPTPFLKNWINIFFCIYINICIIMIKIE